MKLQLILMRAASGIENGRMDLHPEKMEITLDGARGVPVQKYFSSTKDMHTELKTNASLSGLRARLKVPPL